MSKPTGKPRRTVALSAEAVRARAEIARRGSLLNGLSVYKSMASVEELTRTLPELLRLPIYRPWLWSSPFPQSHSNTGRRGLPTHADFPRELVWAVQALRVHKVALRNFLSKKREFDTALLLGNTPLAERTLALVEAEVGVSIWQTEAKVNLLEVTAGFEAQKAYTSTITDDETAAGLTRFVAFWLSFRAEKNASAAEFMRLFNRSVELSGATFHLIHVALGLCPEVDIKTAAVMISVTDTLCVVDRYLWVIATLQALLASGVADNSLLSSIRSIIGTLAGEIDDPHLWRLLVVCGGQVPMQRNDLLPALDQYTSGRAGEDSDEGSQPPSIDLVHLLLRAAAHSGDDAPLRVNPGSLLSSIADDLKTIVDYSPDAVEASTRLDKVALVHANTAWGASLALILERQLSDERVVPATRSQVFHALRSNDENPILAFDFERIGSIDHYLETYFGDTNSPTVAVTRAIAASATSEIWRSISLPPERLARMQALALMRSGFPDAAVKLLCPHFVDSTHDAVFFGVGLILAHAALRADNLALCADVCARLFLRSRYFGSILPIAGLVARILETEDDLAFDAVKGKLGTAIVFDIYSRFVSSDRDPERADAFKDVLRFSDVRFASSLVKMEHQFPLDQLTYFLRQICVPDVLDQSLSLANTRQVEDERANILIVLADLAAQEGTAPPAVDLEELREIRTRQVIRDTKLRVDQSKVYVNVDGIKRTIAVPMRANWQRYKLLAAQRDMGAQLNDLEQLILERTGHQATLVQLNLPVNERSKLFVRMAQEIRDSFSLSTEYGLDANLSTNIRHGYVMRELRAPFVAGRLVSNRISEGGSYLPNMHWQRFAGIDDDLKDRLQSALDRFSEKIDSKIQHLNDDLLRIRSSEKPQGLFNFNIDDTTFGVLQRRSDRIETAEEFVDYIISFLWDLTELSLLDVHNALVEQLLPSMNEAINELESELESLRAGGAMQSLQNAANLMRPEIRSAVERVKSWFTLSGNAEYVDYALQVAHDAGLATVRSYYGQTTIDSKFDTSIVMIGETLPIFVRLFFILLDNAAYHSGSTQKVVISGFAKITDSGLLHISLSNALAEEKELEAVAAKLKRVNADYGREGTSEFIPTEGGSGYPKIWKLLTHDLGRQNAVEITLTGQTVRVDLMVEAKGLTA